MFSIKIVYCQVTMEFADQAGESAPREGGNNRHDHPGGSSSSSLREQQQQQKLLKRTKSLAVISEENRANTRPSNYYRLGEPALSEAFRRQQLIPRAKLINRHSLKDRLSKSQQHLNESFEVSNPRVYRSRLPSDTYSVSDPHVSLPNFIPQNSRQNHNPDRLNILEWPEAPKRYQSIQNLDNVTGLVDVVEENWSTEGNRSIDCIYTQVKRKRKEHRSLDSVLFEDDKELEYFNVLDLLPLSNVRLQFDDRNSSNNSIKAEKRERNRDLFEKNYRKVQSSSDEYEDKYGIDDPDKLRVENRKKEKSYQHSEGLEPDIAEALNASKIEEINDFSKSENRKEDAIYESRVDEEAIGFEDEVFSQKSGKNRVLILDSDQDKFRADVAVVRPVEDYRRIEEAEDYKSIWISDSEDQEEMSRRPQVLKVIDNDVTKRNRTSVIEIGDVTEAMNSAKQTDDSTSEGNDCVITNDSKLSSNEDKANDSQDEVRVDAVKTFFESKCKVNGEAKNERSEGKFGRIINHTTSMFGKACNAVKGSLGFEARSDSSDLGLGSESGSDTRRQSMDGIDEAEDGPKEVANDTENNHSTLSRSFSCSVDSSAKNEVSPEFDHIRYKIMKSDLFSKNMFGSMKNEQVFDGLMQYLQEYSFHDLLVDNNVVIIEPVRAETVERKTTSTKCGGGKGKSPSSCRISGAVEKKCQEQRKVEGDKNAGKQPPKSPKQAGLRRHFFYHPIRVNRELIDDELPDPDTVRNVRKMFEGTLKLKTPDPTFSRNSPTRKTVSMKDLRQISESFDGSEKVDDSRSSSRAKNTANKDGMESPRSESKTRIIAQAFEARSGQTSPSDSGLSKHKGIKYLHNWDAGSVSSGVSSDYPDTDPGSGVQCTSSEDEDEGQDDDDIDNGPGHSVSQDVLKKIRECGTSVTYYGGKVVNTCNSPLISPPITGKIMREIMRNKPKNNEASKDYVKFRLVKSNSCDSRLELAGRLVNDQSKRDKFSKKTGEQINGTSGIEYTPKSDLRKCPIMEGRNVEVVVADEAVDDEIIEPEIKKEPPIVIGLEPKKEEVKEPEIFKADFKLGKLEDTKCYANKFNNNTFNQWQVNDPIQEKKCKFGEIDFEEFEVLEDSLNSNARKN
ncbi:protein javelin isoform X2 [Diprion similis]|uniref:protein javelin isoform X2 n=1 Tax=Diprion similis TaxID=362088 RepID=UPI001EF99C4C|nr:protein javelin isoform X2 [Diprion similis]